MIFYPVTIEPCLDDRLTPPAPSFVAKFQDVPEADWIGDEAEDALDLCVASLRDALVQRYLRGEPMPRPSPIVEGGIGVLAPFYWVI